MRFVVAFMLLVLAVDCLVWWQLLDNLWGLLASGLIVAVCVGLVVSGKLKAKTGQALKGWDLGEGLDITNPDEPLAVERVIIPESILSLGFLGLGGPGSGKSESVAIGYMEYMYRNQSESGFAFFCGKGQKDVYQKCVAAGVAFDYFFSSELPHSDSVNLMEGQAHHVVDRLCGLLIGETQSTTFYADEQRAVLATVVPVLKALGEPVNLRDLYVVLTQDHAAIYVMRKLRDLEYVEPYIVEMADQFFSQDIEKRVSTIRGMLNRLSNFVLGPSAMRLNAYQPSISIERCVQGGQRIYWHFPLSETAKSIATAVTDMHQSVAMMRQQEGGDHRLYPLMFDDWGDFFYARFGPMAARCRSVSMPLSFLFQSVAQLESVGRTFKDELDDTVATKIALRVMGDESGAYIVKKFGQYETLELSQHQNPHNGTGEGTSAQRIDRLSISDLKDLDVGEAYLNTLELHGPKSSNRFFRARFPLVDMVGWESVDWPVKDKLTQGKGLDLWGQYMNRGEQEKAVHNEVRQLIEESA